MPRTWKWAPKRARGKCSVCGQRKPPKNRRVCDHCRYVQKTNPIGIKRYFRKCFECEERPTVKNRRFCEACLYKKQRARMTEEQKEKRRQYWRLRRKTNPSVNAQARERYRRKKEQDAKAA